MARGHVGGRFVDKGRINQDHERGGSTEACGIQTPFLGWAALGQIQEAPGWLGLFLGKGETTPFPKETSRHPLSHFGCSIGSAALLHQCNLGLGCPNHLGQSMLIDF